MIRASDLFKRLCERNWATSGCVKWSIETYEEEETTYLFFAGSKSDGWKHNLDFLPVRPKRKCWSPLVATRGYVRAWEECRDEVLKALLSEYIAFNPNEQKLVIAGWSFGGALAVLAAEEWNYRTGLSAEVVTFGAPKVLFGKKSAGYVRDCCSEVRQYVLKNDIVPHLPPFPGFRHAAAKQMRDHLAPMELLCPAKWHFAYGEEELYWEEIRSE